MSGEFATSRSRLLLPLNLAFVPLSSRNDARYLAVCTGARNNQPIYEEQEHEDTAENCARPRGAAGIRWFVNLGRQGRVVRYLRRLTMPMNQTSSDVGWVAGESTGRGQEEWN
ncbi:MAG: hypothetical protein VX257_11590 [Planctomycetota bacterium]|nr:hypothetical protein [Planctomycetota bacterium]